MENPKLYATAVEDKTLLINFSDSEIAEMKDKYFDEVLKLSTISDEYKKIADEYKAKIKTIKAEMSVFVDNLKKGYKEELKEVFLVPDQDAGIMEYYTENGKLVESRKLRPSERQLTIYDRSMNDANIAQ